MTDLIPDLTAATEGSRDLSDRVLEAVQGWLLTNGDPLPDPTRNLQDAVDLVPDGLHWSAIKRATPLGKNTGEGVVRTPGLRTSKGYQSADEWGHTPQLALCIAILKYSREYMEKT